MEIFNTRDDLINVIPEDSKIVEVGVFVGDFSEKLLSRNPKELFLVDIWTGCAGSGDKDGNYHVDITNMEPVYLSLYRKYQNNPNVHVVRSNSSLFLQGYEKDYFDVIYIDADHREQAVYLDMLSAFQAIKDGGLLMGHDYLTQVKSAVDRFCVDFGQSISYIANDGCPSFGIKIKK